MRRPFSFLAISSAVSALTLAACSADPGAPSEPAAGSEESAIINGKASDASQDAVVLVFYPLGNAAYVCSGSLLAPNLVVTARHCVSDTADQPFTCDQDGVGSAGANTGADLTASNLYIVVGSKRPFDPTAKGAYAAVGSRVIHDGAKNLCNHDIGFIVLDRAIPNAKILPVRVDTPAAKGDSFTAIGWGVTTTTPDPLVRQQRNGVTIDTVGPAQNVPNREFLVGESICQGDSGGPALSEATGAILGVVSHGGNGTQPTSNPATSCTSGFNWYSMASGYKDLFVQAYAAAGQDPWWEGGPDPRLAKFGEACGSNDACRSSLCLTDGSGAFTTCTQACDKSNACPSGYTCNADSSGAGTCAVKPPTTTTTTTKSCSCGIGNVGVSTSAAWCFGIGALALTARRRCRAPRVL